MILYDEFIHASVHDGIKLSRASFKRAFRHNNVTHLKKLLQDSDNHFVFVAIESLYSMDGDYAPVSEIVQVLAQFKNTYLIVDEVNRTF